MIYYLVSLLLNNILPVVLLGSSITINYFLF